MNTLDVQRRVLDVVESGGGMESSKSLVETLSVEGITAGQIGYALTQLKTKGMLAHKRDFCRVCDGRGRTSLWALRAPAEARAEPLGGPDE